MKAGDLVELSAYGKKLKCLHDWRNAFGLIVKVKTKYSNQNRSYEVRWCNDSLNKGCPDLFRDEIRRVK